MDMFFNAVITFVSNVNYLDATQNSVTCVILLVFRLLVHFVVSVYYCDCS